MIRLAEQLNWKSNNPVWHGMYESKQRRIKGPANAFYRCTSWSHFCDISLSRFLLKPGITVAGKRSILLRKAFYRQLFMTA